MSEPFAIPENWRWASFADVARVASNLVSPLEYPHMPHIAPNHIEPKTGRLLPYVTAAEDAVTSPKHLFQSGHILYSKIRPYLAKVVHVDFEGVCSADMYPIETFVDGRYLYWWLLTPTFTELASRFQSRVVLPKINKEALGKLPVPIPPLGEQRRIASAIDEHIFRVERGIEQLSTLIQRIYRFRDMLMMAACTGKLVSDSHGGTGAAKPSPASSVDGALPEIPCHWSWVRLGEIAEVIGGVTKDSKKQSDPTLSEVPYLRVANVQRGRLDLTNVAYIRVPAYKAKQLELRVGDILLNEGGDRDKLGRGWIWEGQIAGCIHQNHVFRARVLNNALHPKLLAWHANGFGKHWCERNGRQSINLASISLSKIKLLPVPLPPPDEQERLVAEAEQYLTLLDSIELTVRNSLSRADKLRKSLLAEAFAGRLVEQDPADEPASVLLERIRAERAAQGPARRGRRGKGETTPQQGTLL